MPLLRSRVPHDPKGASAPVYDTEFAADTARLNRRSQTLSVNTAMRVPYKFDTDRWLDSG